MKRIAIISICAMLGACATQTPEQMQADAQQQAAILCPTATAELATLQSLNADLPDKVNQTVKDATPVITTVCAPGFFATPTNMATFLPAVTAIAVEYAASKK